MSAEYRLPLLAKTDPPYDAVSLRQLSHLFTLIKWTNKGHKLGDSNTKHRQEFSISWTKIAPERVGGWCEQLYVTAKMHHNHEMMQTVTWRSSQWTETRLSFTAATAVLAWGTRCQFHCVSWILTIRDLFIMRMFVWSRPRRVVTCSAPCGNISLTYILTALHVKITKTW